jgi:hypothetical protein
MVYLMLEEFHKTVLSIYFLSDKEACWKYIFLSKLEQNIVDMRPMKVVMNKQLNIQFKGNKDSMK